MARDNFVQITGTLGGDPELRYTSTGIAVASFSLAWSARKKNKDTNEWEDGETSWFRCTAWRDMAENVAATLVKGSRVMVVGSIEIRPYQDRDGNERTSVDVTCDEIGPSLRWAQAQISRIERDKSSGDASAAARAPDPVYGDEEPF